MIRELTVPWFLDRPRLGLATGPDDVVSVPDRQRHSVAAIPSEGSTAEAVAPIHREIAAFVAEAVRDDDLPLVIAGDCCAAIPVAAGLQRAGVRAELVWLDAHGDFNTPATSPSGFLGGMPLAMLTGRGDLAMLDALGATPLADERVRLGDARDLDAAEGDTLSASGVQVASRLDALLATLAEGAVVHLHFDCDVVTRSEVPAQSYPVDGGPGVAEVETFLAALAARTTIAAISVCAWDPSLDEDGRSARLCRRCIDAACGPAP